MRIHINRIPGSLACELFITSDTKSRYESYFTVEKDGNVIGHQFERSGGNRPDVKPMMIVDELFIRDLINAFVSYAREEGFKSADESHTKGKLEATESHLKDMRTLLKLK